MMSSMKIPRKLSLSFVLICVSAAVMMAVFFATIMMIRASTESNNLRWRRKNGQSAKVGSTSMKDGLYDWQTEAVFG